MSWICGICTEALAGDKDCTLTRCGHLFHKQCLQSAVTSTSIWTACPVCHQAVYFMNLTHVGKMYPSLTDDDDSRHATVRQELTTTKDALNQIKAELAQAHVRLERRVSLNNPGLAKQQSDLANAEAKLAMEKQELAEAKVELADATITLAKEKKELAEGKVALAEKEKHFAEAKVTYTQLQKEQAEAYERLAQQQKEVAQANIDLGLHQKKVADSFSGRS